MTNLMKFITVPLVALLATQVSGQFSFGSIFSVVSSTINSVISTPETAKHNVTLKEKDFEERFYPSANWVCTTSEDSGNQISVLGSLTNYLSSSHNDQGATIKMSTPVSIEYKLTNTSSTGKLYTACFYIEKKYQDSPPTPKNTNLRIVKRPAITIYTRIFGGFARTDERWLTEASSLKALVEAKGYKVKSDVMYWNAFDSPLIPINRRNEVWLVKQ